ncbi:Low-affinity potassium transport protein [Pseudocercospora fuligena]|uniref:Low-affinity potassium transport protein n=1 Tax=Pseudocercospora fuligena TaxID=685502 RepID=A0A8H6VI99_9PEZI|nr:Low-affinity potassium transport protein [Pseudocercospora fuligena]
MIVVVARLRWFKARMKAAVAEAESSALSQAPTAVPTASRNDGDASSPRDQPALPVVTGIGHSPSNTGGADSTQLKAAANASREQASNTTSTITWAADTRTPGTGRAFRVPSPREQQKGIELEEVDFERAEEGLPDTESKSRGHSSKQRRLRRIASIRSNISVDRIASNLFVVGETPSNRHSLSRNSTNIDLPRTYSQQRSDATRNVVGAHNWDELGGIEYRSLKLMLKIATAYFVGLHVLGVVCLLPWIHLAPAKYRDYLASQGQDKTWWAFYSAQTMESNLGFTLTPDSMISFADATWPMLVMTFMAYAGNTCYPILLRLVIWTLKKTTTKHQEMQESLNFLLDHPRRCYTLLFPSKPTWILLFILFVLNATDVVLIIILDLNNPAVTYLAPWHRFIAALFQSASARHTGTATFNLANVSPAVQFSLLVMMYIAVYPIAISIRASSSYEDTPMGKYEQELEVDEYRQPGKSYLMNHIRNQLSFDLWYVFLGTFCICVAEAGRIADVDDPAFSVFSIMFEVVSGYGNVGLSLGYPTNLASLSGEFTVFSKLVICAMMIRGRHRGLPYALDRAVTLPGEHLVDEAWDDDAFQRVQGLPLRKFHTQ